MLGADHGDRHEHQDRLEAQHQRQGQHAANAVRQRTGDDAARRIADGQDDHRQERQFAHALLGHASHAADHHQARASADEINDPHHIEGTGFQHLR